MPGQDLDHQSRPGVRPKKARRDRLIALATAQADWAVGFEDETWRSRTARPALQGWSDAGPPRLATLAADDPDPKALAGYGLLLRRPAAAVTTQFLAWCGDRAAATGVTTLVLVWDNAAWHVSRAARRHSATHNRQDHREGGVRIVPCLLPVKSPWLNPIEPKWVHATRRTVEPTRPLTARELEERACAALDCQPVAHLVIPQEVT